MRSYRQQQQESCCRILVTGGATGIGAAAVKVLSEAGADVVATYHRTAPPGQPEVSWVQCDVRDGGMVDDMVKGAAETLDGLDVLLHAAGASLPTTHRCRRRPGDAGRLTSIH
jgi:3-oxoacyl-[acyl-carrier protein] reductase